MISDPKVQFLPVGGEPKAFSCPFLCTRVSELERSALALGLQMLMSALSAWLFSQQIDGAAARIDRSRFSLLVSLTAAGNLSSKFN